MDNDSQHFRLSDAEKAAYFLVEQLSPHAHHIAIAGSIRRRRVIVHDIDLVVVPMVDVEQVGLPGLGPCRNVDRVVQLLQAESAKGDWCQDLSGGAKIQRFTYAWEGLEIPVDVYLATPQTWPTLLLIRTGSKEHNIKLCRQAQSLGLQLKADGSGLLYVSESRFLKVRNEADIFRQLGLPWREPWEREV